MKVYTAHNIAAREWLRENVVPYLDELGIELTSTWVKQDHVGKIGRYLTDEERVRNSALAKEDLRDVARADLVIYFAEKYAERIGTGKHVELGFALGLNKQIAVVGEEGALVSVFHWIDAANVRRYSNFGDLLAELCAATRVLVDKGTVKRK